LEHKNFSLTFKMNFCCYLVRKFHDQIIFNNNKTQARRNAIEHVTCNVTLKTKTFQWYCEMAIFELFFINIDNLRYFVTFIIYNGLVVQKVILNTNIEF